MPMVNGKKYSYSKAGKAAAKREADKSGKKVQYGTKKKSLIKSYK